MRFRFTDGEGFFCNDNRESGGELVEGGVLGCVHCSAAIHRADIDKPKVGITIRAKCWSCDGYLCPECGFATYLHGHSNPDHERTWPQGMWLQRSLEAIYWRSKLGA